ncbi:MULTISPECIES: ABC transporter permease [unclassified Lentimicrobium]|uniref:cell division protein FtsX n=1 Tax=unclassified Lentimicrobium TaxID=2677434 RepID=UPI001553275B|nr:MULTISPECIES: permease-like cell division protein FtsX [unclassified Lentimicrobium]NPD46425.1 cell division protein FtsX [Lentimicrobium sp. S6]NPD84934.1 cell division protein FtsX [Lentimicrobium sp. L6]
MKPQKKVSKRKLQSSYLTTIVSITLVLFMLGLLGLILLNSKKLGDHVRENIGFSIIMNSEVKEARIMELKKNLDASDFVKYTEYITPEEAAEELQKELGEDFIGFLGYNPLLPSIDLRLNAQYANVDSLKVIEAQLLQNTDIKEVYYQESLVEMINANVRRISIFILVFSFLLLVIAIALINNTIRLSVYSKRFLIRSMQLVGATKSFIRTPFILTGILHGLLAALFASMALVGILYFLLQQVPDLVTINDFKLFAVLFGFVIATGVIITWLSNLSAVNKYLKAKPDELYQ